MSKDGDKAAVFKTTKVRTKLRGDNSWLQRRSESQPENETEKPWMAEVRASRLNGANLESSPVSTPVESSPSPLKTSSERSPTSGFMIRGVFTKTEKKPITSNGYSGTTQFTKKPSETYKKIAPHTVKNTENQESQLSPEEQEKRTEAASNVLKKSAARQRSYVLSAAKLYESKDKTPDLLVNSTTSFVAQRVEVTDDDESNTSPSPTKTVPNAAPLPQTQTQVNTSLTQIETKVETKPEDVKADEKIPETDPFENMVPGCTKVATPLPELIPDLVQAVYVKSDDSVAAEQPESPVAEPAPETPAPATPPPQAATTVESIVIVTEEEEQPPQPNLIDSRHLEVSSENVPVSYPDLTPERFQEKEPALVELEPERDIVQIETTEIILKETEEPEVKVEDQKEAEPETETEVFDEPKQDLVEIEVVEVEITSEQEPSPSTNNVELLTDDLLGFNDSDSQLVEPVPSSPGPWSQDLLTPVESEKSEPEKTTNFVDLLSNEDVVITQVPSLLSLIHI